MDSFVRTGIVMRFTRSNCQFPRSTPVTMCATSMPSALQYSVNAFDVNADPQSDTIRLGFPKIVACLLR